VENLLPLELEFIYVNKVALLARVTAHIWSKQLSCHGAIDASTRAC